jgi:Na+-transporting NADH:ubiquinone oxidoreductase subunit B
VRSALDLPTVMRCVLVAAVPCVAMALYNTGLQLLRARAAGATVLSDARAALLGQITSGGSPAKVFDCFVAGALCFGPLLVVGFAAGWSTERLFARLRQRAPDHSALLVIVLLYTLALPPTLPLWKAALGAALAIAVGKEIFGGVGRNLLNPPLTGLAFLYFAYPGALTGDAVWGAVDAMSGATPLGFVRGGGLAGLEAAGIRWSQAALGTVPGAMGATSPLACLLGGIVLLYAGVASGRIIAGGIVGLVLAALAFAWLGDPASGGGLPWYWHLVTGGFAFGLVFLATDPATSAATNAGRWIYGLLIGALVVVIRVANPAHREGVLLAILLGNVMAPLIDQIVARLQMRFGGRTRVD